MQNGNKNHFELLKQKIVATMKQSYPGINPSMSEWKGQEITDFQEDLLTKVKAHISEKWFYNHVKAENKSLPRIDVLNLLSKYAGYANWDDFIFKNTLSEKAIEPVKKGNRYFILVPALVVAIMIIMYTAFKLLSSSEYVLSFYDADTKQTITNDKIEVSILSENESPVNYFCDSTGRLILKTDQRSIKMAVSAPYYQTDTIIRVLKKFSKEEMIGLHANDYALIIHYFSEMNVEDWQKRREHLDNIIDETAMIYQVLSDRSDIGMELYNKKEFIDKLTMPTGSLKHIEILDTKMKNEKIIVMKFRVKK